MNPEKRYWQDRWERKDTGWHQDEVEPELIAYFKDLPPTRVLVPLCGKSLDLLWLASRGHQVTGVELVESACEDFFKENGLTPTVTLTPSFKIFSAKNITLYCGDFFDFTSTLLGTFSALYDRGALIALPSDLRSQYAARINALNHECAQKSEFRFLQLAWERVPHDASGPPYSVTREELEHHYGKAFEIFLIKTEEIDRSTPDSKTYQNVFGLKPLLI